MATEKRLHGTLQRWKEAGFGFITVDGFNDELFCHGRQLAAGGITDPQEGDRYTFITRQTGGGRMCADEIQYEDDDDGGDGARAAVAPARSLQPVRP
jgi:cold shock CspA family protein